MKINSNSVFIYPTDTVWGIGGSIYSQEAYEKIALIKETSVDKPLSIMFTDINQLLLSFNLPKEAMTKEWLEIFFSLESTLGIPLTLSQIAIPFWVTASSEFVSVRCLSNPRLKEIGQILKAPFFTTSLNKTGYPAITNFKDAKKFKEKYAKEAILLGDEKDNLSGQSSTIVFFKNRSFEIIREGRYVKLIKEHLVLAGFSAL